jgi:Holliday junction resolvase RusA-like endonuclease
MANKDKKRSKKFNRFEHLLMVKPMSVNDAFTGRIRKSRTYRAYIKNVLKLLPQVDIPSRGKLEIKLVFGFSNSQADFDNPIKPIVDILKKKYGFDDSRIYSGTICKMLVDHGEEFIHITITKFKGDYDMRTKYAKYKRGGH